MIVDPDFLDHWKTQMLIDTLDDPCAPLYVIRLWAHCHTRRGWVFDIPEAGIKSICKFTGDAGALNQALIDCEFMHREGRQVTMVGWDEHNASLIANWENGKKGGRPPKNKPKQNPTETHGLPMANPEQTHQEPIRYDEIGLDTKDLSPPAKPDDSQAIGKAKAIQMMELFNQVKQEKGANWVEVSDPGLTSDVRYKTAIARAKHVQKRLERKGKPNDWDSVLAWFKTLYEAWADDLFYSGHKETQQHPNGYRRSFESLHAQTSFIESLDRMVGK